MNKPNNPQSEDSNHEDTSSPSNTPLQDSSRRAFVRKSLAAGVLAAQPSILAGLIRANGGGGGETTQQTTDPWGETTQQTTEPWGETTQQTTEPWATTENTTYQTTYTTTVQTTVPGPSNKPLRKTYRVTIYRKDGGGWTTKLTEAQAYTHGALHPVPKPTVVDGTPKPTPKCGGASMSLILSEDTSTTKTHTEIKRLTPIDYSEITVDNTANGRMFAKGYKVTVTYKWIYP